MKLHPLFASACLTLAAGVQAAAQSETPSQPPPIYRYLVVVDTSPAMSARKETTSDTVHKLLFSGVLGRMRTGDTLGVWTCGTRDRRELVPARIWDSRVRARLDFANLIYRLLEQREFAGKAGLDTVIPDLNLEARRSGSLTVFLFTDGSKPVKGTPFDEGINRIFADHAAELRKANKPFLTVLVADKGEWVAHSVNPGALPIHIPSVPGPERPAEKSEEEKRNQPGP